MYKYKPTKAQAKAFAEQLEEIDNFCKKNQIYHTRNYDSYYFEINNKKYRVSNHTVSASLPEYHENGERDFYQCITAGKLRIIDIYNNLKKGLTLTRRGEIEK